MQAVISRLLAHKSFKTSVSLLRGAIMDSISAIDGNTMRFCLLLLLSLNIRLLVELWLQLPLLVSVSA